MNHSFPQTYSRRDFLGMAVGAGILSAHPGWAAEQDVPRDVRELWADFDPRKDPLEVETVREWEEDGVVIRSVRYLVGVYKGVPSRITAFYGVPKVRSGRVPGVLQIHGGGGRASLAEVRLLAGEGYGVLSVSWGGVGSGGAGWQAMEKAEPGDPGIEWGRVDPTQLNVAGYSSMLPGPKQFFEDREHPKNNNWYLLTVACRRGLTFLEQQPEVDPDRLGVHGYSMGGNLTMYVAGTDGRVKCAVPAVGGQGWRWEEHQFEEGRMAQERPQGNLEVFRRTLSFESYAPLIRCPVLHRSSTNDFHGWMDDVYRTNAGIEGQPLRYSWTPHTNHHLAPEVQVTLLLWLDQYLKGGKAVPETPRSEVVWKGGEAVLEVQPGVHPWPVERCDVYYSVESDPRARFWRHAAGVGEGGVYRGRMEVEDPSRPLVAFANVVYRMPEERAVLGGGKAGQVVFSTLLHRVEPGRVAGVRFGDRHQKQIEDFKRGDVDWYRVTASGPGWQRWTRKLTDPKWRGVAGAVLELEVTLPEENELVFVAIENEWRSYRGPKLERVCRKLVAGGAGRKTVRLVAGDFLDPAGKPMADWSQVDVFGMCRAYSSRTVSGGTVRPWKGDAPEFHRLEWA
jgi:hypothetical protein